MTDELEPTQGNDLPPEDATQEAYEEQHPIFDMFENRGEEDGPISLYVGFAEAYLVGIIARVQQWKDRVLEQANAMVLPEYVIEFDVPDSYNEAIVPQFTEALRRGIALVYGQTGIRQTFNSESTEFFRGEPEVPELWRKYTFTVTLRENQ